jgi:hypothetical protein
MKHLGAAAGIVIVLAGAGSAGGAAKVPPPKRSCSWGASSVTAQRVDGQWVVGTATTTGCAP